jgi:hypothetical protein
MRSRRNGIGLGSLVVAAAASTATIETIEVERVEGVYSLHAETLLDASPAAISSVILDFNRFGRISSVYKEYGYLDPQPDGTPTVFTRMEGCLMKHVFCKSMTRVERLEAAESGYIRTVTLPEQSDFLRSTSEWIIEAEGEGARMTYRLEMEPDFWVPPVVGPWYLKRTLLRGGGDAIDRIERLAQDVEAVEQAAALDAASASFRGESAIGAAIAQGH